MKVKRGVVWQYYRGTESARVDVVVERWVNKNQTLTQETTIHFPFPSQSMSVSFNHDNLIQTTLFSPACFVHLQHVSLFGCVFSLCSIFTKCQIAEKVVFFLISVLSVCMCSVFLSCRSVELSRPSCNSL